MIYDHGYMQESINRIGGIIVKLLPQGWRKAVFRMEIDKDNFNWNAYYSFAEKTSGDNVKEHLYLGNDILIELEKIRNIKHFPNMTTEIIFYNDGKYEFHIDDSEIKNNVLDLHEVQQIIHELKQIDLELANIDDIKERLGAIGIGYKLNSPIIPIGKKLYRGVKWENKPQRVTELTYPSEVFINNFHRAGRPGQSLFYCSTAREAPFYEIGLTIGEKVAISYWETTAPLLVNNVGYHEEVFKRLGSNRREPSWDNVPNTDEFNRINSSIGELFATEFAKIVPPGQEYLYKMSIAIAELHFSHDLFGGLCYPSMGMRANADNLALKPKCVDTYLKLKKVEYIRIDETNDCGINVTILDFANTFNEDGIIEWKGRHPHWIMRGEGEVLYISLENGNWVARNEQGEIVEPE